MTISCSSRKCRLKYIIGHLVMIKVLSLLCISAFTFTPRQVKGFSSGYFSSLTSIPEEDEDVPLPFFDRTENSFIECYADSIITVEGIEYTIGVPYDYCV